MKTMENRTILITGATGGLGYACAKEARLQGAHLILAGRSGQSLTEIRDKLRWEVSSRCVIGDTRLNLDALDNQMLRNLPIIDGVIHCAGVYGPMGPFHKACIYTWMHAVEANLFGTATVVHRLLPDMIERKSGRIVLLSGGGATSPMPFISSYAAAKSGVVRFAESLAGELDGTGVYVNCVAPGALNTKMLDEVLDAGPERVGAEFYQKALNQKNSGGASIECAAKLCVALCSEAAGDMTGRLISAAWDPWDPIGDFVERVRGTEHGRLRRISVLTGSLWNLS